MRRAALIALCVACKTASSASSHATAQVEQQTDASGKVTTTETVRTGPETVTTTTSEYAAPAAVPPLSDPVTKASAAVRPLHRGPLIRRTVVVDVRAPAVAVTRAEGTTAVETRTETKTEATAQTQRSNAPAGLLGSLVGLWPILLLAILLLAGWIGWRVVRARVP